MKRILIDGRFIGVGESMTRYCLEIVKGILELDKENEYTLLVRPQGKKLTADSLQLKAKNLHMEILDIPHYSMAEQTKLLKYLNKERFDLVHFIQFNHPVRYRGKFVVTIHDLTLFGHLHRKDHLRRLGFGAVMKSAVKNSAKIITVSETTKQDIIDYYHVSKDKIVVTYLGVDGKYNNRIKNQESRIRNFKEKYSISGEYLIYTGMWKKHKNLIRMLKAFEKYKSEFLNPKSEIMSKSQNPNIQLVLVGKPDPNEPEVIKKINEINQHFCHPEREQRVEGSSNDRITNQESRITMENPDSRLKILNSDRHQPIITTGFIDEEELPLAYAGALAYVIPSLSEGFGLPPLEAMACGTPVLSSNISAMPEILGEAPLYFDPYNIEDMAVKMGQIVEDENLRSELSKKGLEQAVKYSWSRTAEKTLGVYRELLE